MYNTTITLLSFLFASTIIAYAPVLIAILLIKYTNITQYIEQWEDRFISDSDWSDYCDSTEPLYIWAAAWLDVALVTSTALGSLFLGTLLAISLGI